MLKNLKIGARLGLGFGLLLALLTVMAGVAAWQMGRLADNAAYYAVNLVPSYEVEHEVSLALANVRRMENLHILMNTDAEMDAVEAKMAAYRTTMAAAFDKYAKDLVSDATDKAALEQARAAVEAYYAEWDAIRKVSRKTKRRHGHGRGRDEVAARRVQPQI